MHEVPVAQSAKTGRRQTIGQSKTVKKKVRQFVLTQQIKTHETKERIVCDSEVKGLSKKFLSI